MTPRWRHHCDEHRHVATFCDLDIYQIKNDVVGAAWSARDWYIVRYGNWPGCGVDDHMFVGNTRIAYLDGFGVQFFTERQTLALRAFLKLEGRGRD